MNEKPLHVTRYDGGRWLVRSERKADEHYLVETGDPAYPLGRCCCDDYNIRIEAPLRRGEEPERDTCKHVDAVCAEIHYARELCEAAGMPFNIAIIPIHGEE